ncbi:MAG: GTPase/DUF3482 domain-containing protein [Pseudomonadota bacterium]|nr:GTPase/DUF3482 domain-containing protein [Pseudomonadota bacterium]
MDPGPLQIAIMGHPNAGKSSVVATLTENDSIGIGNTPGTTTRSDRYPVTIDGRTLIEFIDTPGFQNPGDLLEWFKVHRDEENVAAAFIRTHESNELYVHDCELLRPVSEGAGIILVIDGSTRIRQKDRDEIELLRLTRRPRMAILNNMTDRENYQSQWDSELRMSFNSVREFNAHRATYAERIDLLNAMKSIEQGWEPRFKLAISAFEEDWDNRIDQTIETIVDLFRTVLEYKVSKRVDPEKVSTRTGEKRVRTQLVKRLEEGIRRFEKSAQQEIRAHFRHNVWNVPPGSLLMEDLFSEQVSHGLGLSKAQLAVAGMAAGGIAGGLLDTTTAGVTLGAFALLGAAGGGVTAWIGGSALTRMDIQRMLGSVRVTVGPVSRDGFLFVLLDRILLYCARAMNWSHGRQGADEDAANRVPEKRLEPAGFAQDLSASQRKSMVRFFAAARKGRDSPAEEAFREILGTTLHELSVGTIDSREGV